MSLAGRNTTSAKNERKPITLLSPRFLSLFPDDGDSGESVSLLSPSVLSMHDQGKGLEKNTSLPSLLKDFSPTDRQQWINFIMEAAGINERTNAMLSEVDEIANLAGIADPPLMGSARANKTGNELMIDGEIIAQFNDTNILSSDDQKIHEEHIDADLEMRKLQVWDQLTNSYTPQQLRELNKTGTAILTPAQLNFIYGEGIEEDVHRMADMHTMQFPFPALKKGATARGVKPLLTARVSAHCWLDHYWFGTVILSPGVFVPLILSPYLTRPQILSPGVFNPAILSPLLFSPSILSPQVSVQPF
uniref:Uncharacterized protein n=2 Tax=Ditylenchus dipsaci TaxID=166011 RepID=A0A915DYW9_9BILA